MTQQELDYLHSQDKVPDWWYYQQSDKPIWMKWQEQTDKFYNDILEREKKEKEKKEFERLVEQELDEKIDTIVQAALNELFKDFQ